MPSTLRLILGDQLNRQHSWFQEIDDQVTYVLMELRSETDYAPHHIQKVLGFFGAMRRFASWLEEQGHRVLYLPLDDPENKQGFSANLEWLVEGKGFDRFEYQLPDEYRLDQELSGLEKDLGIPVEAVDSEHFLTERGFLKNFFSGKKTYLMESFYREMRQHYNILMQEDGEPVQGRWNFDAENRNKYDGEVPIPKPPLLDHDLSELAQMIEEAGVKTIGTADPAHYPWPLDRNEALENLAFFARECLPHFGTYQDAMVAGEPFLFHARVSFALNTKMLSPLEIVQRVIDEWENRPEEIDLAQVEGFVRQIIGWREYMRGVYWAHMPDYEKENFFGHDRPLPEWFWTGETKMNCLHQAISQSLDKAYAHHIQRLMVTGNFALLAGIDPAEVDNWYLGIYIDAIQWVEITNTRGMSQYADGGKVGTKPYVSSANYMDKMSDYCGGCHYKKTKKTGEDACPFNSLYWHFYERNRDKLEKNPRIGFVYPTLNRMNADKKSAMFERAEWCLENLEKL